MGTFVGHFMHSDFYLVFSIILKKFRLGKAV